MYFNVEPKEVPLFFLRPTGVCPRITEDNQFVIKEQELVFLKYN